MGLGSGRNENSRLELRNGDAKLHFTDQLVEFEGNRHKSNRILRLWHPEFFMKCFDYAFETKCARATAFTPFKSSLPVPRRGNASTFRKLSGLGIQRFGSPESASSRIT